MGALRRLVAAALLLALPALAWGQSQEAAAQIKAAYLYKFGAFVEWPQEAFADAQAPLVIGVLGAEAFAGALEQIVAGRKVHERPVALRRLGPQDALEGVHILFIGAAHDARIAAIAAAERGRPLLIVSESESATERGSMINFVIAQNRVRFDVAPAPAEAVGLRISARLLTVARRVKGVS